MPCEEIEIGYTIDECTPEGRVPVEFTLTNRSSDFAEYTVDYDGGGTVDYTSGPIAGSGGFETRTHEYAGSAPQAVFTVTLADGTVCVRPFSLDLPNCQACDVLVTPFINEECSDTDQTREVTIIVQNNNLNSDVTVTSIHWDAATEETFNQSIGPGCVFPFSHDYAAATAGPLAAIVHFAECADESVSGFIGSCPPIEVSDCPSVIITPTQGPCDNNNRTLNVTAEIIGATGQNVDASLEVGSATPENGSGIGFVSLSGSTTAASGDIVAVRVIINDPPGCRDDVTNIEITPCGGGGEETCGGLCTLFIFLFVGASFLALLSGIIGNPLLAAASFVVLLLSLAVLRLIGSQCGECAKILCQYKAAVFYAVFLFAAAVLALLSIIASVLAIPLIIGAVVALVLARQYWCDYIVCVRGR